MSSRKLLENTKTNAGATSGSLSIMQKSNGMSLLQKSDESGTLPKRRIMGQIQRTNTLSVFEPCKTKFT